MLELYPFLIEEVGGGMSAIGRGIMLAIHMLLVQLPYSLFVLLTEFISFALRVVDFESENMRESFFEASQTIFQSFTTTTTVGTDSLFGLVLIVVLVRLIYLFFLGNGGFGKEVVRVLMIIIFMFTWFGNVSLGGETVRGGLLIVRTVDTFTETIAENMTLTLIGEEVITEDGLSDVLITQTIRPIFNFVNSGNFEGCYIRGGSVEDGGCLDMDAIRSSRQQDYINSIAEDNPYVRLVFFPMIYSLLAIIFGIVELLFVSSVMLLVRIITIGAILLSATLFLVIPVAVIASFIPQFSDFVFRIIGKMVGLMFVPVFLVFLLTLFLYLNNLIDTEMIRRVNEVTGGVGSATNDLFGKFISLIVRMILLVLIWKNRHSLLQLLSDGKFGRLGKMGMLNTLINKNGEEKEEREMKDGVRDDGTVVGDVAYEMELFEGQKRESNTSDGTEIFEAEFREINPEEQNQKQGDEKPEPAMFEDEFNDQTQKGLESEVENGEFEDFDLEEQNQKQGDEKSEPVMFEDELNDQRQEGLESEVENGEFEDFDLGEQNQNNEKPEISNLEKDIDPEVFGDEFKENNLGEQNQNNKKPEISNLEKDIDPEVFGDEFKENNLGEQNQNNKKPEVSNSEKDVELEVLDTKNNVVSEESGSDPKIQKQAMFNAEENVGAEIFKGESKVQEQKSLELDVEDVLNKEEYQVEENFLNYLNEMRQD